MSMPSLSSVNSAHDFHKFHIYQNGVVPAVHFHLAASINPETGRLYNYRVSKWGNTCIYNILSKLIEKIFFINYRLLIKCIFRQISVCFFIPFMHMLVFLCYLLHVHVYAYLFDQFCLNMAVKFAFWIKKKSKFSY